MRLGGALIVVGLLCAPAGCSPSEPLEPSGPLGLESEEAPAVSEDSLEYLEERMAEDDPRARIRIALRKDGQKDDIPKDASLAELEALLAERVDEGIIPKEHAKKLLKVLESADAHNERLERLDEELFGGNAY